MSLRGDSSELHPSVGASGPREGFSQGSSLASNSIDWAGSRERSSEDSRGPKREWNDSGGGG